MNRDSSIMTPWRPTLKLEVSQIYSDSYVYIVSMTNVLVVRLVNGEHRIGVFARKFCPQCYIKWQTAPILSSTVKNIASGAEIFLNYGDSFFKNDSDHGDKKKPKEVRVENMFELDQHSSDETYDD